MVPEASASAYPPLVWLKQPSIFWADPESWLEAWPAELCADGSDEGIVDDGLVVDEGLLGLALGC